MKQIAVVTGASSGMGREFVLQLNSFCPGLDEIWVMARRGGRLERLALQSRVPLRILEGDITKKKICRRLKDLLEEQKPVVRVLINAAGFGRTGSVEKIAAENPAMQTDMISLNCRALTRITEICLPFMRRGSRIINLASAAAFCPQPYFAVYAATKAYVLSFSRALAGELKQKKIYVTAVCPGPVKTEFFQISGGPTGPLKKRIAADAPDVVRQALKDSLAKKELSVFGPVMKAAMAGAKLLPHRLIMKGYKQENRNERTDNPGKRSRPAAG